MVVRIFTCLWMLSLFIACGRPESQETTKDGNIVASRINSDSHTPITENKFNKCPEELAPISSSFTGSFYDHHRNSPYLIGQIADYADESDFTQDLKDLSFTMDEPCKQIKIAFSGDFANNTALKLKISKTDAKRELAKASRLTIKNFAPSYFAVINDSLPDNMSRLPNHYFEISVSCPTGMTVFCSPEGENCDSSKALKAKFPDQPCAIKGTNQVFALYPSGQALINFEGTITKIRTTENDVDEVDIKFTNVEWR